MSWRTLCLLMLLGAGRQARTAAAIAAGAQGGDRQRSRGRQL
jgi:hypothetical protein